jgi:hypothetical protein
MEVWRLQALHLFKINVQSAWNTISKGDIDGSQVGHVFYVDKDIDRIVTYCEKDTTSFRFFLGLEGKIY